MRALHRKLLRDTRRMWGQLGAIALIVAAAIATYVTMRGSYEALLEARTTYYASHRFAHLFAQVKRAPLRLVEDIARIDGVSHVDPRIVVNVPLTVPGVQEPASARIVSAEGSLNLLHLRMGRLPEASSVVEVVASEQFVRANHLKPGDTLSAVLNGKWERLRIVGVGSTPEYLVEVAGAAAVPDHERFAILWAPRAALEGAFSMRGAFNDLSLLLSPGADEARVINEMDHLLARYGGPGAFGRDDHHPHEVLESEITQLRVAAMIDPLIFLFVSAFLINMVLSRLVSGERDQIAIMKAFGHSNATIAAHYSGFAVIVVVAGSIAGIPLGIWFGRGMMGLYLDLFNFPRLEFSIAPVSAAISVAVTLVAAVGAALRSTLTAARVPPAEGMRGERPPSYHTTRLEPLNRMLSSAARMIVRSIERRPVRALLSISGIALTVMMLIAGRYTFDAIDALLTVHLRTAERHDVMVSFVEPRRASVALELARLPGVRRVETFRAVPAKIYSGHHTRRLAVMGLPRDAELRRLVAADRSITPLPERGVVLTKILSEAIGAPRGSRVRFETLEQRRVTFEADVVAISDELLGLGAYMQADELARLAGESDLASGAYLSVDGGSREELDRQLKNMPAIGGVAYREKMIRAFLKTIAKSLDVATRMIVIFACVIAFGVIYNSARIALSERGRDLATLRVLGFSRREAGALLLGEQALLTFAAIPAGFVLGRLLVSWLSYLFTTEEYRLVAVVTAKTYAFAFVVVMAASALSAAAVWSRIVKLDLVEVLKTRE